LEFVFNLEAAKWYTLNLNANYYYNQIDAFEVENLYPVPTFFKIGRQSMNSGNVKLNSNFHFKKGFDVQFTAIYLAPDIIPQGKVSQRFTMNLGIKKMIQKGKGELFVNATDLGNTLVVKKEIQGNGFKYSSIDYFETQVIRFGYTYKF
jgi:hypothetical protein